MAKAKITKKLSLLLLDKMFYDTDVEEVIQKLPERARQGLTLRYGLDGKGRRTCKEGAEELGLSRSRIGQMENKGIRMLRNEVLKPYEGMAKYHAEERYKDGYSMGFKDGYLKGRKRERENNLKLIGDKNE